MLPECLCACYNCHHRLLNPRSQVVLLQSGYYCVLAEEWGVSKGIKALFNL